MRVRAQDASGDYTFGQSAANFLVNDDDMVAQLVLTRLLLMQGEWFLDVTVGTPYATQILGKGTKPLYDQAIKAQILGTQGVTAITVYSSNLDDTSRTLSISATINTIYGPITITTALTISGPT